MKLSRLKRKLLATLAVVSIPLLQQVNAASFGFAGLNANEVNVAGQLQLEVTDPGTGVVFTIKNLNNTGSTNVFIGDIFLDTGGSNLLGSVDSLIEMIGVDYEARGGNGGLPEGNNALPAFVSNTNLDQSPNGGASNAINRGEELGIRFTLVSGVVFSEVLNALNVGTIRVGLHLQGYASGGSDSYVNIGRLLPPPGPTVPDSGGTLVLLCGGLAAISWLARRR